MPAHRSHLASFALGLGSLGLLTVAATTGGCKTEDDTAVATATSDTKTATAKPAAGKHDDHGAASAPAGQKTELGKGETPATRADVDDDGVVRRGTKLPASGEPLTVADCMEKSAELDGKPVLIAGRVSKVCAKKGCWWSIENPKDRAVKVRITHKDYGFFVPSDAEGKAALAYGLLEVKKLSLEESEHMAQDEGRELDDKTKAALAKEPEVELRLVATALEMRGS